MEELNNDGDRKKGLWILTLVKFVRVFAYAFISIILPVYLVEEGYSELFVGVVITLTILAAVGFNLLVMFFIHRIGAKKFLYFLSGLMFLSGLLFALDLNAVMIIAAALLGAISVTGAETGAFQSIENSMISAMSTSKDRTKRFSFYNFAAFVAVSVGSLFSGLPDVLSSWGISLKVMFLVYSGFAVAIAVIYVFLPRIRLAEESKSVLTVSKKTKRVVTNLALLYSVDAFAGGFVLQSIMALWFYSRFGLDLKSLSILFFGSGILTAASMLAAPWVAKKMGLLRTMVVSHLVSNVFLICIPLMPSVYLAVGFYFLRQSISQMDVPTRQSYTMAIIPAKDRAPAAALTNIPRTMSQALSPLLATYLISITAYSLPLFLGGGLKMLYDVGIYFAFKDIKPPEER